MYGRAFHCAAPAPQRFDNNGSAGDQSPAGTAKSAKSTRVIVFGNDVPTLVELGRALSALGYDGLPVVDAANARNVARLSGRVAMVIAGLYVWR
jgi:hypothetical protein